MRSMIIPSSCVQYLYTEHDIIKPNIYLYAAASSILNTDCILGNSFPKLQTQIFYLLANNPENLFNLKENC